MEATSRDHAQRIWRQLATHNQWHLIGDEQTLLDQVCAEVQPSSSDRDLRLAMQRIYSQRLYQGLQEREERAAYETWLFCLRLGMRDRIGEDEANTLAQEATTRILQKLDQVQSASSFIAWVLKVFRTTKRDLRSKLPGPPPPPNPDDPPDAEPSDPTDIPTVVEQRDFEQALAMQLQAILTNQLEYITLSRYIFSGDNPRDVAHDLGLPLYRTRSAKSRAIQRLRQNPSFMAFIATHTSAASGRVLDTEGEEDEYKPSVI